ncbi:MAG: hypothetical protein AAGI11_21615 [Pseudomonadota bacterium]
MPRFESNSMPFLSVERARRDPHKTLTDWLSVRDEQDALLLVAFELDQYWLAGEAPRPLTAIYAWREHKLLMAVTEHELATEAASVPDLLALWRQRYGLELVDASAPLALAPQYIAKPWGQEIWFTGVEERGVCELRTGSITTPIPWLQAAAPEDLLGQAGEALVLLKVLDPVSEAVTGELYFELHEEKREVYVVTHVDRQAWPDGQGYIRYGFDASVLAGYPDEDAFRAAYLGAVRDYEVVRRRIDSLKETEIVPQALLEQEAILRETMNAFTHMRPLSEGDVVKVPLGLPHSLQHGVRTIEFQTPVYERKILSFAQQVLTQDHWDTEAAAAQMLLYTPPPEPSRLLGSSPGWREEQIVDFPDFEVSRVLLNGVDAYPLIARSSYQLIMVISGNLSLAGLSIGPEQAAIVPRSWAGELRTASAGQECVFLRAWPRRTAVEPS